MAILGIKEREKTFLQDAPILLSSLFIDAVNGVVAACVPIPLATHKDWCGSGGAHNLSRPGWGQIQGLSSPLRWQKKKSWHILGFEGDPLLEEKV